MGIPSRPPTLPQADRAGAAVDVVPSAGLGLGVAARTGSEEPCRRAEQLSHFLQMCSGRTAAPMRSFRPVAAVARGLAEHENIEAQRPGNLPRA